MSTLVKHLVCVDIQIKNSSDSIRFKIELSLEKKRFWDISAKNILTQTRKSQNWRKFYNSRL